MHHRLNYILKTVTLIENNAGYSIRIERNSCMVLIH